MQKDHLVNTWQLSNNISISVAYIQLRILAFHIVKLTEVKTQ